MPGPLYHNAPFSLSTVGLFMGHHLVVLPKFDADAALDAIGDHGVNWMNLVPTMMLRMLRAVQADPDRYDLSSLRVVWHMAAPCPEWLKEAWIDLVGAEKLMELYGGTEAPGGDDHQRHRVARRTAARSASRSPGQMKVLDADGNPAPPGEVGEIYMRRARRHARRPTATSAPKPASSTAGSRSATWAGWTTTATSTSATAAPT